MISFKKIIAALLASAITALSCTAVVFAENDTSSEDNTVYRYSPNWINYSGYSFSMKAGTHVFLPVQLSDTEQADFSFLKLTMTSTSEEIVIDKTTHKIYKSLNSELYNDSFEVTAAETSIAGKYPVTLTIESYDNNKTLIATQNMNFSMEVTSELDPSGLTIVSCKQSKDVLKPGDSFNLVVTLKNTSGIDIKDAEVELTDMEQAKFVLDKGFTKQYVNIPNGKTGTVTFPMIAQKGIQYLRETIGLKLTYTLDKDKPSLKRETNTSVILTCQPDAEKIAESFGAHDLTMTSYAASSDSIKDGTKFSLTVEIKNNSNNDMSSARSWIQRFQYKSR